MQMLAKDPMRRFADGATLARAVGSVRSGVSMPPAGPLTGALVPSSSATAVLRPPGPAVAARPAASAPTVTPTPPALRPAPPPPVFPAATAGRRTGIAVLVVVFVLALVALAAVLVVRSTRSEGPDPRSAPVSSASAATFSRMFSTNEVLFGHVRQPAGARIRRDLQGHRPGWSLPADGAGPGRGRGRTHPTPEPGQERQHPLMPPTTPDDDLLARTPMTGTLFGDRYQVGDTLGFGGMSEVHRGRDLRLGRDVAIKVLRADLARDPSFQARFRREAQNAASLNHPAIVAVYDTGETRGESGPIPYIVMEYVDGETLRDLLKREGSLAPRRAMEITADICAALDFSHRHGIVHRDIKPANVMLTPGRRGQGDGLRHRPSGGRRAIDHDRDRRRHRHGSVPVPGAGPG